MVMRLPLLTRVQESRGQHQGNSPDPQGHTFSPVSIVAEYCLVIATFILLRILPKSRGRQGQQTTVAGAGAGEGGAKTPPRGRESECHCSLSRVARPLPCPTRCCCQSGAAAHATSARRARSARKTPPRHFRTDAHSSACARGRISAWWHRRRSPLKPGPSLSLLFSSSLSHGSRIKRLLNAT